MMRVYGRLAIVMMIATVVVLFGVAMLQNPVVLADDSDDDSQLCENAAAVGARNLAPGFTGDNRLVLTDWNTGEQVQVLDEDLTDRYGFNWSPDCRILVGYSLEYNNCNPSLIIWNISDGKRVFESSGFCEHLYASYARVFWKSDSSVGLLTAWYSSVSSDYSNYPRILFHSVTNQALPLKIMGLQPHLHQVYWDETRNWVWSSAYGGVTAFDIQSGQQVISFDNPPIADRDALRHTLYEPPDSNFAFSPDGSKVIISGQRDVLKRFFPAMTVYDIASGAEVQVNVERNGAGAVALSPDNRYLVMGYDALRVWDLQNLPESVEDRLPIYRHGGPGGIVKTMRFIDDVTIETTTDGGVTRWNLHSGELVE